MRTNSDILTPWVILSIIFIIMGMLVIIIFALYDPFNLLSEGFKDIDIPSKYGTFIGGIVGSFFSLAGIFLLIETLKKHNFQFQFQHFENNFFEFLRIHRDHINNSKSLYIYLKDGSPIYWQGKKVFVKIIGEFSLIKDEVKKLNKKNLLKEKDIDNLSINILFFGVDNYGKTKIMEKLGSSIDKYSLETIIDYFNELRKDNNRRYYDGHQIILGEYYQHFNSILKYVDQQPKPIDKFKKDFIKLFKDHLTNYEMDLLNHVYKSDLCNELFKDSKHLLKQYQFIKE